MQPQPDHKITIIVRGSSEEQATSLAQGFLVDTRLMLGDAQATVEQAMAGDRDPATGETGLRWKLVQHWPFRGKG
jgi:hypothetical protein